jgi:hypothetical protein
MLADANKTMRYKSMINFFLRTPEDDSLSVETCSVDLKSINKDMCCADGWI